jgi:hypothetical protein
MLMPQNLFFDSKLNNLISKMGEEKMGEEEIGELKMREERNRTYKAVKNYVIFFLIYI